MKEVTIQYDNPKTLQILKDIAKYFDFSISTTKHNEKMVKSKKLGYVNGVAYTPGDTSIDISELSELFTGKNINARELRTIAWQRQK